MKKIKTFEDACKALGLDPGKLPDVSMLPEKHQKALVAHYKLVIITQALNLREDGTQWEPNWHDADQLKYTAWFEIKATAKKPGGCGFSDAICAGWYQNSTVSSRLCFPSAEIAIYAGKQFSKLYQEYFLITG